MAGYLSDARRHAKKIEHYYQHAGSRGYTQALYHYEELTRLVFSAMKSKKHKGKASLINSIRMSMQKMMDEMKDREKGSDNK
jgi:hypothetical protein